MLSMLKYNIRDMLESLITDHVLDAFWSPVGVFSTASTTDFMSPSISVYQPLLEGYWLGYCEFQERYTEAN